MVVNPAIKPKIYVTLNQFVSFSILNSVHACIDRFTVTTLSADLIHEFSYVCARVIVHDLDGTPSSETRYFVPCA